MDTNELEKRLLLPSDSLKRELDEREEDILTLSNSFLRQLKDSPGKFDEATVDTNFIFRFDPVWSRSVNVIRRMMGGLLGLTKTTFSPKEGARILVHIERHLDIHLEVHIEKHDEKFISYTFAMSEKVYKPINPKFRDAIQHTNIDLRSKALDNQQSIRDKILLEANQTQKIIGELHWISKAYQLIPLSEHRSRYYSTAEIQRMFQRVINWVIYGEVVPTFIWPSTLLLENKIDEGVTRAIRPWPNGKWEIMPGAGRTWIKNDKKTKKRMSIRTRVNTWGIYYLTRRGGGMLTEAKGLYLWNKVFFNEYIERPHYVKNYQMTRMRLFLEGSEKTLK